MNAEPTVFVVDDDRDVRDSLRDLVKSVKLAVKSYDSGESFLNEYDPSVPGCLLLDVRMPGMSGLEVQETLRARKLHIPIIFMTGHGDIPMAVQAVQNGALDFLKKPVREQALLDRIRTALERDAELRRRQARRLAAENRLAALTAREREVLDHVCAGKQNKMIAAELGISHKTVEFHRSKIMIKLQANTVADLIRLAQAASG